MDKHKIENKYGTFIAEYKSEIEVDGEIGWKLSFTPCCDIPKNSSIKIEFPAFAHQISHEYVQTYDYWKPYYLYAHCMKEDTQVSVRIEKISSAFSNIIRWSDSDRIAVITLLDGLSADDCLYIIFGGIDRPYLTGDAPPSRIGTTSCRIDGTYIKYKTAIDVGDGYQNTDIMPKIKVNPQKPCRIKLFAPSLISPETDFDVKVMVTDRFNNPIFDYDTSCFEYILTDLKTGDIMPFTGKILRCGYYNIGVIDAMGLDVDNAAVICKETTDKIFWGDLHNHSNLTANIRDNNFDATPQNAYEYARYVSILDYVCLSEQTYKFTENDGTDITKQTWNQMGSVCDEYYSKGDFTTFAGVEIHSPRGDTVILFGNSLLDYAYPPAEVEDITDIWDYYDGMDIITIPHFHRYSGGRWSKDQHDRKYGFNLDLWSADSHFEPLCEIFSGQWGRFENESNPMILKARSNISDNNAVSFLKRGKGWGFTSGSDGHDATPGYSGLTGVIAKENNRSALYNSLMERKTICTTHPRIAMEFYIDGDIICINCAAPSCITKLEIISNNGIIKSIKPNKKFIEYRFDAAILNKGDFVYPRVTLGDGHMAWASPLWADREK